MGLSRTVSKTDIDFRWKSQNFPTLVFCAPAEKVPLGIGYRCIGVTKLEWWASRSNKKFDDIFSRLDRMHERDGRTNRQTDTGRQQRPRLRIASCGKNCTLGTKTNTQRRKSTTLNKWLWPWSCTSLHHYVATYRSLKVAGQVLILGFCGSSSSSCRCTGSRCTWNFGLCPFLALVGPDFVNITGLYYQTVDKWANAVRRR